MKLIDTADIHQAARMLFAARLDRMSEEEIEQVVNARQSNRKCHANQLPKLTVLAVPVNVMTTDRYNETTASALMMIGGMALHKYQLISPT